MKKYFHHPETFDYTRLQKLEEMVCDMVGYNTAGFHREVITDRRKRKYCELKGFMCLAAHDILHYSWEAIAYYFGRTRVSATREAQKILDYASVYPEIAEQVKRIYEASAKIDHPDEE